MTNWQVLIVVFITSGMALLFGLRKGYVIGFAQGLIAGVTARIERVEHLELEENNK